MPEPSGGNTRERLFHGLMLLASVLLLNANVTRIRVARDAHMPVPLLRYVGTVFWVATLAFFLRSLWHDLRGSRAGGKVV